MENNEKNIPQEKTKKSNDFTKMAIGIVVFILFMIVLKYLLDFLNII